MASRRKAEELIKAGNIFVNGERVTAMGIKIDPQKDVVEYNHQKVQPQHHIYIILNKPRGITSTTRRFKGEKNVVDLVKSKEKLFPVGRLDKESEGLMILTNDGEWAQRQSHPKYQVEKEYAVELRSAVSKQQLEKMREGIFDDHELLKVKKYVLHSPTSVTLILTQGHKREIRRLFSHFDIPIKSLKRTRIGKWKLGNLKTGEHQEFTPN